MKGKGKIKTNTCEWVRTDSVEGDKCTAEDAEEFMKPDNLIKVLQFRANLLLQRTGLELS